MEKHSLGKSSLAHWTDQIPNELLQIKRVVSEALLDLAEVQLHSCVTNLFQASSGDERLPSSHQVHEAANRPAVDFVVVALLVAFGCDV